MELKEHGHQDCDNSIEHESHLNNDVLDEYLTIFLPSAIIVCIERPLDTFQPGIGHGKNDIVGDNQNVNQEQNEKFAVPKPDTVVDPRTVMVHVQNTSIAR